MKKMFTLSILAFLLVFQLKAQDPRFSQFYAGALHLNPAMTGVFEGSFRFAANYREQWTSIISSNPYRTIGAGVDMRFKIVGDDYFAAGLDAMGDEAGFANYRQVKGHLSLSYLKQLSGSRYRKDDQYLIVGAQLGLGQSSLNWSKLWFSRQFDTGTESVNTGTASGETFKENSITYPDFNAGILWYSLYGEHNSLYLGGAFYHINSPNITFVGAKNDVLYRRFLIHGGGEFPLNKQLSMLPAVLAMLQGPSFETNFGTNFRYSNHDWNELAIRAGIWARLANKNSSGILMDAMIFTAMLELDRWNVGFSYDINTSSLAKATNSRGAFELSLVYVHPYTSRYKVNCPKF